MSINYWSLIKRMICTIFWRSITSQFLCSVPLFCRLIKSRCCKTYIPEKRFRMFSSSRCQSVFKKISDELLRSASIISFRSRHFPVFLQWRTFCLHHFFHVTVLRSRTPITDSILLFMLYKRAGWKGSVIYTQQRGSLSFANLLRAGKLYNGTRRTNLLKFKSNPLLPVRRVFMYGTFWFVSHTLNPFFPFSIL